VSPGGIAQSWPMSPLLVAALLVGMLAMMEAGRALRRRLAPESVSTGVGAVEGAVFGLMGLLLAFTFSGAASRFEQRRQLIVEEANDIGTAYLRLDLLPPEPRAVLQELVRQYVDARLAGYHAIPDMVQVRSALDRSAAVQAEIWSRAVAASAAAPPPAAMLLLPALNAMFDISTTRYQATLAHPPFVIFAMLGAVALLCSLLAGYAMGALAVRSWLHVVGFVGVLAFTVYLIADIEYPRLGLVRVDTFDQALIDVRAGMR
jgi:hypothetical protein